MFNSIRRSPSLAIFLLGFIVSVPVGCRGSNPKGASLLVGKPRPAGFVDHERMRRDKNYPFQLVWIDPDYQRPPTASYFIAPVDTSHIVNKLWFNDINTRYAISDHEKDLADIAQYTRQTLIEEFDAAARPGKVHLANEPSSSTHVLELSLVELIPAEPALVAAGWVVPGVSLGSRPTVGFEGRVRLAQTNKVVATFAFRDHPDFAIVDIESLKSHYDANRDVIREWSKLLVQVANETYDPKKRNIIPLTLISW